MIYCVADVLNSKPNCGAIATSHPAEIDVVKLFFFFDDALIPSDDDVTREINILTSRNVLNRCFSLECLLIF